MSDRDALLKVLGQAIRARRGKLGISQEELGARSELDRTYIGGVERGERNVSFLNLAKIARALGAELHELMRDVERARE